MVQGRFHIGNLGVDQTKKSYSQQVRCEMAFNDNNSDHREKEVNGESAPTVWPFIFFFF